MVDADAAAILEQLRDSELIAQGRVAVVALDAIAERLGPRWRQRREVVHAHAEKVLHDGLGPLAVVQKINEWEYLIAQSATPGPAVQLKCLDCLREILVHFLGAASPADLAVHQVTAISDHAIMGARADLSQVEAAHRLSTASAPAHAASKASSIAPWTPIEGSKQRRVEVSCELELLTHLPTWRPIGLRISPLARTGADGAGEMSRRELEARLSDAELEQVDTVVLSQGLAGLARRDEKAPLSLMLPASYRTLRSVRGRRRVTELLRRAESAVRGRLICELTGIEAAPAFVVREIVRSLRPFCAYFVGWLADLDDPDYSRLKALGLSGLSTDADAIGLNGHVVQPPRQALRAMAKVSKAFFLHGVKDRKAADAAARAGFTHVSSNLLGRSIAEPASNDATTT